MLFSTANNLQAIKYPFNWNADYTDGTNYSEYDLKTHKSNDFYLIKKKMVVRFGLFGLGMKFFFEMIDGSFNLRGKRVDIEYHCDNGEILHLTHNFEYKDLITYKQAYTDLSKNQGVQRSHIHSINFGYKTKINKNDLELFFQPIVSLPFNDSVYIETKLTSNKKLNGYLVFKVRGKESERFYAPLEPNKAGQVNWTVK